MDTLSNASDTKYELPLSEADQTALRPALLRDLGALPFAAHALISRSLWVIFIGEWGVWTHAILPVDDRLDVPDEENITGLCDLVGSLIRPPQCHDDEKAMIVLHRPGSAEISEADATSSAWCVRRLPAERPHLGRSTWWGRTEYGR